MEQTLQQKLYKINQLQREIDQCEKVLEIFNFKERLDTEDGDSELVDSDLKPKLIIDHLDPEGEWWDGERTQTTIPGALSQEMTTLIERHVNSINNGNIELLASLLK